MKSGRLVLVVGASGAGKDSVLRYARQRLAGDHRFVFPRRVVTRQADIVAEDHESADDPGFVVLAAQGAFTLRWQAHGLKYGIRREIEDHLRRGCLVAINVSRTIIPDTVLRFPNAVIAEIHAAAEIRLARIAERGRETPSEGLSRNQRDVALSSTALLHRITNDGDIEEAGEAFCRLLIDEAGVNPYRAQARQ